MKSFEFAALRIGGVATSHQGRGFFPPTANEIYRKIGKRAFDLTIAVLLAPMALLIVGGVALVVSRDGGSAFFGHKRIGKDGKVFKCWKIRSMVVDAEQRLAEHLENNPDAAKEWALDHKLTNDPRITALGNFLRKSSLDELPQLWNVVRGDMSLVGPRPIVRVELHKYGTHCSDYMSVKPGVTGLWQVSGRNDISYDERVQLDVDYVKKASFGLDVKLILKTAMAVVSRTGK